MKILQVINIGYPAGGAELSARLIRDELQKRGHEVKVFSSNMQGAGMFADFQLQMISPTSPRKLLQYLFYPRSYSTMRKIIKEFQPDLIHFHTIEFFSPSIFFAVGDTPTVMTVHGPEHFTLKLLPWCIPAHEYKHTPFDLTNLTIGGRLHYLYLRFLQRPVYRMGLRHVRVFIAPSNYLAETIRDDVAPARIIQIYNGITLPQQQPLPQNQRVLYVGRLEKVKGVEYLIRAFADVVLMAPNAKLRIVGDGAQRAELEQLASTLKLASHVEFAGWVKAEEVVNEYRDAVMLAVPSVWPENLPTVCIEALAVGRAIVGTQTGGIPELINDGETGYIVPIKDSKALSKALVSLLNDRSLLVTIGRTAAESSKRFGVDHFIDQIEDLYIKLL